MSKVFLFPIRIKIYLNKFKLKGLLILKQQNEKIATVYSNMVTSVQQNFHQTFNP